MSGERVLLAWELGGNLGHLARMLALAEQIEQAGDEPVWALPAHAMESPQLKHIRHRRVKVPYPVVVSDKVELHSYASILFNLGFGNPAGTAQAVGAWRELYEQVRPHRMVLDTAPMAQLAAYLYRWPAIRISNGFDSPPARCPSFGIGMRGPYIDRLNAQHVSAVGTALGRVAEKLGVAASGMSLDGYLTYPRRYFDCIPQTDPYGERDDVTYVGPLNRLAGCEAPQWPERRGGPTVFAYLRGAPMTQPLLEALARIEASVLCVVGGHPIDVPAAMAGRIHVSRRPVLLDEAVRQADLVVSYAPLGLLTHARLHGKPQLLMPSDLEKTLGARRLQASRAAVVVQRAQALGDALSTALAARISPVNGQPPPKDWMYRP